MTQAIRRLLQSRGLLGPKANTGVREATRSQAASEASDRTRVDLEPVSGGSICDAFRVQVGDVTYFAKTPPHRAPAMLEQEAAGLSWLRDAGAQTPEVVAVNDDAIILQWVEQHEPNPTTARAFGRSLARTHSVCASSYGCAPRTHSSDRIWVGSLQVPAGRWSSWATFYVCARVSPILDQASSAVTTHDRKLIERLCEQLLAEPERFVGPKIEARRIHGDLWSGNVLWTRDSATMIDPAAHGGHPETDLAMLQLFGSPHFDQIVAGYQSVRALPDGWQARTPLHQLFPVLVHAALFGGGYGRQAGALANQCLSSRLG